MSKLGRSLLNLLLAITSTLVGLVLAEIIYEHFEPREQAAALLQNQYAFFKYDPLLGWGNVPNREGTFARTDFKTRVHINSEGMRYHEVGLKKKFRVAVLGDSFAWGQGVEENERFTDIIEDQLNVEMLNFGVSGYGPVQYYLQLDKVLNYQPDLVVIAFFLFNDFNDNMAGYRHLHYVPYATLEDGKLTLRGYPIVDSGLFGTKVRAFINEFALGRLFYRVWNIAPGRRAFVEWSRRSHRRSSDPVANIGGIKTIGPYDLYVNTDDPDVQHMIHITEALLAAIQKKLAENNVPLLIVAIPSKEDLGNDTAFKTLSRITQDLHIPLETGLKGVMEPGHYFRHDDHWNRGGHRKAAKILAPAISQWSKTKPRPPIPPVEKGTKAGKH